MRGPRVFSILGNTVTFLMKVGIMAETITSAGEIIPGAINITTKIRAVWAITKIINTVIIEGIMRVEMAITVTIRGIIREELVITEAIILEVIMATVVANMAILLITINIGETRAVGEMAGKIIRIIKGVVSSKRLISRLLSRHRNRNRETTRPLNPSKFRVSGWGNLHNKC